MKILTKKCLECGQTISKPLNESVEAWEMRHKFCSRSCSAKHRQPGKSNQFTKERHYVPPTAFKKGVRFSPETEFKKGHVSWSKLHPQSMPTPWNKGKVGVMPPVWNKGLNYSQIPKVICQICGTEFQPRQRSKASRFCSKVCQYKALSNLIPQFGENNPAWKGGITKLQTQIRHCKQYEQWRKQVFERDQYQCRLCGNHKGDKHADHYPTSFAQLLFDYKITSLEQAIACAQLWDINSGRTLCVPCHKKTETYLKKLNGSL